MNFGLRLLFVSIPLYILLVVAGFAADAPAGWSIPRFSDDAAALYKAASSVNAKPGTDAILQYYEESHIYDGQGKEVRTTYLVYKILSQKGAEGWDGISISWEPWHENKPEIRARVITADGMIHPLDNKTISDTRASETDDNVYSDRRILRAPLPAVAPGSVVEEEVVVKENAPLFDAGVVSQTYFNWNVPVQELRLVLDAPTTLPIHYGKQLLPDTQEKRNEADGRMRVVFIQGPMEPHEETPDLLARDIAYGPRVTFSTARSWQAVAERYARIVDEKVALADVQGLVARLVKGKATREEKMTAILQYLSREVRYTGVEFDEAAIIPQSPTETLKHKYGDCKDKATLLIAMLRAAGVPSYLALLNAGNREDVPADFPGIGLFDHAIVYVPGEPDFWIDATDEYARLGQLPILDQGRQALIARAESKSLMQIPEAASQSNVILEKREFYLAENGPSRVVETTEPRGIFEAQFRSRYEDEANKNLKKDLTDYVKSEYLAEQLTRLERSNPADLSKQFRLTLEVGEAKRGFTDLESSAAAIRLDSIFNRLPDELQEREKAEDKKDAGGEKPAKPRSEDYELPVPYVKEYQYRIIPPPGFVAKPLPPDNKITVGPATLSEEFSLDQDGSVRATVHFDTGKRRLSVAEATEMRNKVAALKEQQAVLVAFEPTTQALMGAGKTREAFQASRDLIKQHPNKAVYHLLRAKALLSAGMGQTAREEAREAVKLDPSSALAEKTLADILEYDSVGRRLRHGSDYAGAEAAFRMAEKLDPNDRATVGSLAILLEHSPWGLRYGPGAKLNDAITEYRKLSSEDLKELGIPNNLTFALFYAGEFSEARKNAEALNPQLNVPIVACEAVLNGTQAALAEARKRTTGEEQFKQLAKAAGDMLTNIRRYAIAADLLEAGASGSSASGTTADAIAYRYAQPHETMVFPEDPPGIALHSYALESNTELTPAQMSSIASRNGQLALAIPRRVEILAKEEKATFASKAKNGSFADVGVDLAVARAQPKAEGNDVAGYKVTLWGAASYKSAVYVVLENGKYKVLGTTRFREGVALEALDRVAANDIAGARQLLDWLREDLHLRGDDDPLSGWPFSRIWTKGRPAETPTVRIAAASVLMVMKETAPKGISILETARTTASSDTEKVNIALALQAGYSLLEQYDKALAISNDLAKQYPESQLAFLNQTFTLRLLGRFEEADQVAQDRLRRMQGDIDAMRALVSNAAAREDYILARSLDQRIVDEGKAEAQDLNSLAWHSLFAGKVDDSDIRSALKAAQLSQNSASILHTLGSVYAEVGKTREARDVLIQAMDSLALDEPDDNYWYAFGRMAEQDGEIDAAIGDYTRVKKPEKANAIPDSCYRLAQNRLKALLSVTNGTVQNSSKH